MARNGSGTYNLVTNTWFPPVDGVTATSVDWDTFISDIASALTQSVSKDGQTTMTGNLPMGNNKLTGLAAGTATGDSLRWQQLFSQGAPVTVASAATTDIGVQNSVAIEITGTTTITSFGPNYNGPRFLRFTGALVLTHNATTLNLPGAANITTVAGDTCIAYPNSSSNGWNVVQYQRVSAAPTASPTVQVFTASGTYTRPAGVRRIRVRVVGGGGAGGATSGANQAAGGGGGGGYSEETLDASAITTVTVTIGAGGTSAGTPTGGTTSFGAFLSAAGGAGAIGSSANAGQGEGGAGGVGSGGDVNITGGAGGNNYANVCGGTGGNSALGGGAKATYNGGAGNTGANYGGGGSGGGSNAGVVAGGSGAAGVCIVEEFY